MWSARWGHTLTVYNDTSYKRNLENERKNSSLSSSTSPILVLIGGDDYGQVTGMDNSFKDEGLLKSTSGGFLNDVWISKSHDGSHDDWRLNETWHPVDWAIDFRAVISKMKWEQTNPGRKTPVKWPSGPKLGTPMTFEEWIQCQDYFTPSQTDTSELCLDPLVRQSMFSPRRGHGSVVANNILYVIGGRAQEYVAAQNSELIRGVIDHRVQTVRDHRSIREDLILKNDVWVSDDGLGFEWRLVTPGCKDPQLDVLLNSDPKSLEVNSALGSWGIQCTINEDCYGEAVCHSLDSADKVCICPMFGPREHHSVSVQHRFFNERDDKIFLEDYIYIVGGFTNVRRKFCSSRSCGTSSSYRIALDDAWVSNDGRNWIQMRPVTSFSSYNKYHGRGAHASLVVPFNKFTEGYTTDRLWIFGGETSAFTNITTTYLNDVWSVDLHTDPCCYYRGTCYEKAHPLKDEDVGLCLPSMKDWIETNAAAKWMARSGHAAVHEPPSAQNQFRDLIYIYGGGNDEGALGDTWVWELGCDYNWTKDFDDDQLYRHGNDGVLFRAKDPNQSPYRPYFNPLSPLSYLFQQYLPTAGKMGDQTMQPTRLPLMTEKNIATLANSGLKTVTDLSHADIYTVLRLRGVDPPSAVNDTIPNICYVIQLSRLLEKKCAIDAENRDVVYTAPAVTSICLRPNKTDDDKLDPRCIAEYWDGCDPIEGYSTVNVYKVGEVPVPQRREDVSMDLQDLHCQVTPLPRVSAAAAYYHGKVLIAGGKGHKDLILFQDVWQRDDVFPKSSIKNFPKSNSTDTSFSFGANKASTFLIEYKVFDAIERLDVTPWIATTILEGADLSWLNRNTGGPGNGWYTIYIRGVDSCGNREIAYSLSSNSYHWFYVSPLPWGKIIGLTVLFLLILCYSYIEIRRRLRKRALERIVLQRMRQRYKFRPDLSEDPWKGNNAEYRPRAPPLSTQKNPTIDIEATNMVKSKGATSQNLVKRKNYRMVADSSSSDSDRSDRKKYFHQPKVSLNSNASFINSTPAFSWDGIDSTDSDSSTGLRRRRELQHRGKRPAQGRRMNRNRPSGRITPKKMS